MKDWQRAPLSSRCGSCGSPIPENDPMLKVQIGTLRPLSRCEDCAGQPVNWEQILKPVVQERSPTTFRPLGELALKARGDWPDHRIKQIGSDE